MFKENGRRANGHWGVVRFPGPPPEGQLGILPQSRFELLQNMPPDLVEPALVLHSVRVVASGLLDEKTASVNDGRFLSAAYHYFTAHACDHEGCAPAINQRPAYLQANNSRQRGWSLLVAEDVLGLIGVIHAQDSLHGDDRPARLQRTLDFGRPTHRGHATRLLREAGDRAGLHANASQEIFSNRVRGLRYVILGAHWFMTAALNAPQIDEQPARHGEYITPNALNLADKRSALGAFLVNVTRHDGKML